MSHGCPRPLLALLLTALVGQASDTLKLDTYRLRIRTTPTDEARHWRRFADTCARETRRIVPAADDLPWVTLVVGDSLRDNAPLQVRASGGGADLQQTTHRLALALLLQRLSPPEGPPPLLQHADWLAAAVTHRVLFSQRETGLRLQPDFEAARRSFQRGHFPHMTRLITEPLPPLHPVLYRLYAMHCDLLVRCLLVDAPRDDDRLLQFVTMTARGRDPVSALHLLLHADLSAGRSLQSWYEAHVRRTSRAGRRLQSVYTILTRLGRIETVPVLAPGRHAFRTRRVLLDEAPEILREYRLDGEALRQVQQKVYELAKDAPPPLRRPILDYVEAFALLADGKRRRFCRDIKRVRYDTEAAANAYRQIERYVDDVEDTMVSRESRIGPLMHGVARHRRLSRQLAPELHTYLDVLESPLGPRQDN